MNELTKQLQEIMVPKAALIAYEYQEGHERSKSLEVIANSLAGFNHSKYAWLEWDEASNCLLYTSRCV